MLAAPGHAEDGHHDGKVCLSEWKAFFDWCAEHGGAEKFLVKAEKATAASQKTFNARVEAAFEAMDTDHSGELSLPEMERTFGEETHDYWEEMDGKIQSILCILLAHALYYICLWFAFCETMVGPLR